MQWFPLLAQEAAADESFFRPPGGLFLVSMILVVSAALLWVFALVDAIKNPGLKGNQRLIWIVVILLTNILGALIYVVFVRKRRA